MAQQKQNAQNHQRFCHAAAQDELQKALRSKQAQQQGEESAFKEAEQLLELQKIQQKKDKLPWSVALEAKGKKE